MAAATIATTLGLKVEQHDDGRRPGMHDLSIITADGSPATVEVTAAADPDSIQLWKLVNRRDERWTVPDLQGGWMLHLEPTARAKRLFQELPAFLGELEGQGITEIPSQRRRQEVPESIEGRARARSSFGAALYLGEPRDARLAAGPARAGRARQVRLRPPSHPWLVVVWRDALHLRRAPARVAAAAGYLAAAALLLNAGPRQGWTAAAVALLAHGASGQLLETARLDADDPRRSRLFAADTGRVAVQHAALATVVLVLLGWTVAAVAASTGAAELGRLPLVLSLVALLAPVPVVAGLLSAYKGRPPLFLAVSGDEQGPIALLGWYLVGPLTSLSLLSPLGLLPPSAGTLGLVLSALVTGVGTSTMGLAAVARRTRRLHDDQ